MPLPDDSLLGIFAKEPLAGQVKTRLAQSTSPAWAQQVAAACLEDWLDRLGDINTRRVIAYAPDSATEYFSHWEPRGYELFPQGEGDLGQRLQHFFRRQRTRGFERIVVVGSDSPTVPLAYIEQAFQALTTHDVVLGPACDGGYYLIGTKSDQLGIFDEIPWSTAQVLERTVQRIEKARARLALLPPWYDVDTVQDWALLRGHVRAIRQVGLDPGVPRLEHLMNDESS